MTLDASRIDATAVTPDADAVPLEAKLHPPAVHARTITRHRLLDGIAADPHPPIVTLIAPPGYGKTELLSQVFASADGCAAWLSLDDLDNEPSVLVRSLAAAIDRAADPADRAAALDTGKRVRPVSAAGLARLLHEPGAPGLVVVDDLHRLTNRASLDVLAAVLEHLPPGTRVALGSRTAPDIPLGRYRARGALLELDTSDLALDADEARDLAAGMGVTVDTTQVDELVELTEGWAAAIYLALLARRRAHEGAEFAVRVSGSDTYIADYLRSELAASFPEDALAFLARTSILETVEPALADAVGERAGSGVMLETLARTSQLISKIGARPVYRYHQLLRSFLLAEIEAGDSALIPDLHRRAATWYDEADRPEAAIEHALAAGDLGQAADVISRVFLRVYYGGHGDQLERWLGRYGDDDLRRHPNLAVLAGWLYVLSGRAGAAERVADFAERAVAEGPAGDGSASLASSWAMLRAAMCRHGIEELRSDAMLAASEEGPGSAWRYLALYELAAADLLAGDEVEADRLLAEAVAHAYGVGHAPFYGLALRSSLAMARGDWVAGSALARESHMQFERTVLVRMATTVHVHAVAARAAMHEGDLRAARQELVHAQLARPNASHAAPWTSVLALMELARAYLAISDASGARTVLAEAEAIVRRRPQLGVLVGQLEEMRRRVADARATFVGSSALTTAELRLLPNLSTPYTFKEIGERLFLSPHTVKTQAISIYNKLDASSRSEAVERAIELGLLEPFPGVPERRRTGG